MRATPFTADLRVFIGTRQYEFLNGILDRSVLD